MSLSRRFSPCVVIPCYNHGATLPVLLARLAPFGLPCFIVDDGSTPPIQPLLESLSTDYPDVTVIRLPQNAGKGAAVLKGFAAAATVGATHVVQVDADGQHCIDDLAELLQQAQRYPGKLISGLPVYDHSIPKSRRYGRYLTHVWVWIETLSLSLKDSLCGFRVYPLAPVISLTAQYSLGQRMDFDTEIMVRLYWQGTDSHFVPTRVIYPPAGLSHFDLWRDNLRLSWLHARLFFGMLIRLPSLLRCRQQHWSRVKERQGLMGMRWMIGFYRLLGRAPFELLLRPVMAYFWLTGHPQRQASQHYLARVKQTAQQKSLTLPHHLNSYRHFLRFGSAMLDKIASWRGDLRLGQEILFAPNALPAMNLQRESGQLILASHLGDIEVCRALAQHEGKRVINALVFSEHLPRFTQILKEFAPQAGIHLIPISHIGPETALLLKEKLAAGEWVATVGDRTAVNPQRGKERGVVWSSFLGSLAPFPQGPFVLASLLGCPVVLMFALRQQGKLCIHCEPFADPLRLPRPQRAAALQAVVDRYASRLEHYALQSPLDWFNFFDFWQLPELPSSQE